MMFEKELRIELDFATIADMAYELSGKLGLDIDIVKIKFDDKVIGFKPKFEKHFLSKKTGMKIVKNEKETV